MSTKKHRGKRGCAEQHTHTPARPAPPRGRGTRHKPEGDCGLGPNHCWLKTGVKDHQRWKASVELAVGIQAGELTEEDSGQILPRLRPKPKWTAAAVPTTASSRCLL